MANSKAEEFSIILHLIPMMLMILLQDVIIATARCPLILILPRK